MPFEDAGEEWSHSRAFGIPGHGLFIFSNLAEAPDAQEDEVTRITRFAEGSEGTFYLPWVARSLQFLQLAVPTMAFVGLYGEYAIFQGPVERSGLIDPTGTGPGVLGVIRAATLVDDRLIVVGMGRQAYMLRFDDDLARLTWNRIDNGILSPPGPGPVVGFNTISGFSAAEVYAAGLQGEIWIWTGDAWQSIDSPTNVALECVACGRDGLAYICGRRGVLLRGRQERWEPVEHHSTEADLWCALWFADRLLLASSRAVFALGPENELGPVLDDRKVPSVTCGWLTALGDRVYSIGPSHVLQSKDLDRWEPVAD